MSVKTGDVELCKRPLIVGVLTDLYLSDAITAKRAGADILELRIDFLEERDVARIREFVKKVKENVKLPVIATNRAKSEGGRFEGAEEERISLLEGVMEAADAVDIELSTVLKDVRIVEKAKKLGITTIISFHDFTGTPSRDEISNIIEKMHELGDVAKVAVTPKSLEDTLTLLELTLSSRGRKPVVTIGMGALGRHTRIVAPLYGSALTYGSVNESVAPGQMSVWELRKILDLLA
ncbi:MAG TPA: type I 3-dehydroquinate dehydratase [Methanomicrobia archaeon]|nr:type I 3-dehydroquinate dehydratase [Methanomicrobia archaeon]HEX59197.1 type I 3-dehydroquinate dehydratase [Methanomicrobia archaeon]